MFMSSYLYAYVIPLIIMAIVDGLWLGLVATAFYKKQLGFIMAKKPNWLAAIIFYLVYIFGLTVFVIYPDWKNLSSLAKVALMGGIYGLVTYATYDLTNQATLKKWPTIVSLVDIAWGIILSSIVALLSILILKEIS